MRKLVLTLFVVLSGVSLMAQSDDLPKDFLGKDFYRDRRAKLREKMAPNTVAVVFANAERNRANDVDYYYHQDPDFYYLTGYKEANSVLLVFKDKQTAPNGVTYDEIMFVQPRDPQAESWTGRRLGDQGVKDQLGFGVAFNNSEFRKYGVDFTKFAAVLFFDFKNDVRNDPRDSSDLYDLIAQFKVKAHYPDNTPTLATEPQKNNLDKKSLGDFMGQLRMIKTTEELVLLKKAIKVSCQAQVEVMKALKPGMSELEISGIHEYVFKKYQAESMGYPSIVGAGHNGCILHYEENYKPSVLGTELILMDLGAEYHGYTADITRTIPVSGKFSPEQKQIYELVLKAQEDGMKVAKAGVSILDVNKATQTTIYKGLLDLGVVTVESDARKYYPHGCCHNIGLDVHDRGVRGVTLAENQTITIEPGIYIPDNSPCDKKWWGIGVRIEDDYRITKEGYEHLSVLAPRTVKDIEAMMKLTSPLDNMQLPNLDK